ncbi:uncharacterized protein LOC112350017 [Selaginella moellendorffii]|uniref:uncharacterized protein LOC112350017 n=1 Tax=Selaginella moellendorffii TaxID=88036 RepID=UPI000D1C2BC3|nr:uncharacterized protein LOC112350017 [Selaginella moellendorffii]|eukprot:XP_024541224.1 uncharacterized protein LOC112350017 [Selaginella moellendorffii]
MAMINASAAASAFGIGSSGTKLRSGLGSKRVFCGRCCSRLVAPSLWMRAGTSCVRANSKNQSESIALDDADALASRDSMEDGGGIDVRGNLADGKNHESVETEGEEKSPVWISRGSLEDTGGSDATEVLETFTGTDHKNNEQESGKVGSEAFDSRREKDLDDIEQQYLLNDKLAASGSGVQAAAESITGNSEAVGENLKNLLQETLPDGGKNPVFSTPETPDSSPGGENASAFLPGSSGRDWRVWATAIPDEQEKSKKTLGNSESKCDEGSKTKDPAKIADRLGYLEEIVMKKDNSKSPEDYNRRATIFEKSDQAFKAEKSNKESTAS